jgi:hypothetical protein
MKKTRVKKSHDTVPLCFVCHFDICDNVYNPPLKKSNVGNYSRPCITQTQPAAASKWHKFSHVRTFAIWVLDSANRNIAQHQNDCGLF